MLRNAQDLRSNLTRLVRFRLAKAASGRQREPRRGWLASFALAFGAALCSPTWAHAPLQKIVINDKVKDH